MSKINYYQYHNMTEKLFFGVALTDEHMNKATDQIVKYLCDGGAHDILGALGIMLLEREYGGSVIHRRLVYKLDRRELTVKEICNIGLFLPYGAFYGSCGIPELSI